MGQGLFSRSSKCLLVLFLVFLCTGNLFSESSEKILQQNMTNRGSLVAIIKPKTSDTLIKNQTHIMIKKDNNSYLYFCRYRGDFAVSRYNLNWKHLKTYNFSVKNYSAQTPFNVSIGQDSIYVMIYNLSSVNANLDNGELAVINTDLKSHKMYTINTAGIVDGRFNDQVYLYSYNFKYKGLPWGSVMQGGIFYDYNTNSIKKTIAYNYNNYDISSAMSVNWESEKPGDRYAIMRTKDGVMVMTLMNHENGQINVIANLSSQIDSKMHTTIGWDNSEHVLKDGRNVTYGYETRSGNYLFCDVTIDPCNSVNWEQYFLIYNINTGKIKIIKNPLPDKPRPFSLNPFDYIDGYLFVNCSWFVYKIKVGLI